MREPSFRAQLEIDAAPVLITNYRWEWLDPEDRDFVRSRYISIAPRLLVLGGSDPGSEGRLAIHRDGRYLIDAATGAPVTIDGEPLPADRTLTLARGWHTWSGSGVTWAWLGPDLTAIPDPGALLQNRDLFVSD